MTVGEEKRDAQLAHNATDDNEREHGCVRTCVICQLLFLQLARAHKSRASHLFPSVTSQLPANI